MAAVAAALEEDNPAGTGVLLLVSRESIGGGRGGEEISHSGDVTVFVVAPDGEGVAEVGREELPALSAAVAADFTKAA